MIRLILSRIESNESYTHGRLDVLHVLELPWRDNQTDISCIPRGVYLCQWGRGNLIHVRDVPGRIGIQIHPGNFIHETRGCLLPGLDWQRHGVVTGSLDAFKLLERLTGRCNFELEIHDAGKEISSDENQTAVK
jgi:hypothetical protein